MGGVSSYISLKRIADYLEYWVEGTADNETEGQKALRRSRIERMSNLSRALRP